MPPRRPGRRRTRGQSGNRGRVARAGQGSTRGNRARRRAASTSIAVETGLRRSARIYHRLTGVELGAEVEPEDSSLASAEDQFSRDELRSRGLEAEPARRNQREQTIRDQASESEQREPTPAPIPRARDRATTTDSSSSRHPPRPDGGPLDHDPSTAVEMEIMSQPPAESGRSAILYPPLTVRLRSQNFDHNTSVALAGDLSQLWAVVSLMNEHGTESLAPPRQDLLVGTVTASPRPLARSDPSDLDENESESFVMFSDLAIRESGRYRLRVTLIQMQSSGPPGGPLSGPLGGPLGGSSIQEVQTGTIQISDHPQRAEPNSIPFFLEVLRRRGVVVPSPSH
ncbi:MAG: hypothetical protein M1823_001059 [Watsoniomyces obsoletus]|nr:MAG: hypothetical protein M1823_001059 [Watsoniomyces obsoletus]